MNSKKNYQRGLSYSILNSKLFRKTYDASNYRSCYPNHWNTFRSCPSGLSIMVKLEANVETFSDTCWLKEHLHASLIEKVQRCRSILSANVNCSNGTDIFICIDCFLYHWYFIFKSAVIVISSESFIYLDEEQLHKIKILTEKLTEKQP